MNYKAVQVKAQKAIKKNGAPCFIKRTGAEVYNPLNNTYETEVIVIKGYAVQDNYSEISLGNTEVQAGDIKLMAVFDEKPLNGDQIEFGENTYTICSVPKAISPDGKTVIYYEVQCR